MHIRDEHTRKDVKKRMKRLFVTRSHAAATTHVNASTAARPSTSMVAQSPGLESPQLELDGARSDHGTAQSGMRNIISRHNQMLEEDETDQDPVTVSSVIGRRIPLGDLFDFSNDHWVKMYEGSARRSFDDELEMYELLDLDAAGEEEVDVDLDDSTGDLMMS